MFWLLSLFIPSLRRQSGDPPFDNLSQVIKSPQSRGNLFKIVGMIAAAGAIWFVLAAILSLFNAWFVVALAIALGVVVDTKERKQRRRDHWIQQGRCANCGYDLRATPDVCPECGRDARLDEPIWRRMRRELEAKLLADASNVEIEIPSRPDQPAAPSNVTLVTKRPKADDTPIPLEGD